MTNRYDPHAIEPRVQQYWLDNESFAVSTSDAPKYYALAMFPYPSGKLHMGHVRNYTIVDAIARSKRMQGYNTLQPMGWDAFGLPAENAAIDNNTAPATWTYANIDYMKQQLQRLGFAIDWSREVATCDASYYRWEQWFFLKMYEKGLVYRQDAWVNWDPVDQTVLANEQVIDGRGWRSGAVVERKKMPHWFIKITAYADELLDGLDTIDWPKQVVQMQRNWIGRSTGANIRFALADTNSIGTKYIEVFTTRADTLFGATYLAIAIEHPLVAELEQTAALQDFIATCKAQAKDAQTHDRLEKKGFNTGLSAIHPLTGEHLPIWIANFVLLEYGFGAVMSVPAHDQRDFDFATQYNLPIVPVIAASDSPPDAPYTQAYVGDGSLINSQQFNGMDSNQAKTAIAQAVADTGAGETTVQYRLRDWGVSRQRYWGAPIPMVHCQHCGVVPSARGRPTSGIAHRCYARRTRLPPHQTRSIFLPPPAHNAGTLLAVRPIPLIRSLNQAGISRVLPAPMLTAWSMPRIVIGYQSTNTLVVLNTLFCTCSMHGFSTKPCAIFSTKLITH